MHNSFFYHGKKIHFHIKHMLFFIFCIFSTFFAINTSPSPVFAQNEVPLFKVRGIGGGGGFFSPAFSPYDKNLIFVACDMSGVYRSDNGGKSWQMLHAKTSPRTAYFYLSPIFLTEKRMAAVHNWNLISISEDKGLTWKSLPPGSWLKEKKQGENDKRKKRITSFLPLNTDGKIFFIASEFGLWLGEKKISGKPCAYIERIGQDIFCIENKNTLLKSSDNGESWERITLPDEVTAFSGVHTPDKKSLLYIATKNKGILSSTNEGKNWNTHTNDFSNIRKIIIPKGQTNLAYAMQGYGTSLPQILRTIDGGETWEETFIMHGEQERFWQEINVERSWLQTHLHWSYYFTNFVVSPHDSNTLLASTQGELFISKNSGKTWEIFFSETLSPLEGDTTPRNKSVGLEVTSVWGYYYDPHDTNREYIAYTDVGFARSLDKGQTWSWSAKGSPWTNTFYDLAFDPKIPGKIYAATSRLHDIPHFTSVSKIFPENKVHQGGLVVSTDYGKTWKVPYKRKEKNSLPEQVCTSVVVDPTSPPEKRTLFASVFGESDNAAGVYVSHDDGKTWSPTPSQPGGYNKHIYKLRIHPKTGDLYCLITGLRAPKPHYFNIDEGGIWVSSDKGNSWKHISKGSKLNHWATSIAFHPTDPNGLYVSAATPQGVYAGGIYYTKNNGKKWWHILKDNNIGKLNGTKGYTYDHWMSVYVHPKKSTLIFAGASIHGLFFSTDGGRRWRWCKEFPFSNAQSITTNPHNPDELIVTTFGSGVWSASLKELLQRYKISYDKL